MALNPNAEREKYNSIWELLPVPLDIYNRPSKVYFIKPEGRIYYQLPLILNALLHVA